VSAPAIALDSAAVGPNVGPLPADLERWTTADELARPARLAALRERMAAEGIDAYFAVRRENIRYLIGFDLADGEEKVAGHSGQSLISADEVVILADSRYSIQAHEQAPGARVEFTRYDLPERWAKLVASLRAGGRRRKIRRVAAEAAVMTHSLWLALAEAAPDVELVAAGTWIEETREIKEPAEIERIAAACRLGDAGLEALLPRIQAGVTERELAWKLEAWLRSHGAEALAFPVTTLGGARAAMPHGSPGDRPIRDGEVLLFDFGAQVAGYRSDMTRTLFVGEPSARDRSVYELVLRAQQASLDVLERSVRAGDPLSGHAADRAGRELIEEAGYGANFGHNTGHGIGLATHERPTLGNTGPEAVLPSPTVFSVEPGVYIGGETGVRLEDLVAYDVEAGRVERLTHFPREVTVVGA
jgi:Xaa-Pro aminopeptidase